MCCWKEGSCVVEGYSVCLSICCANPAFWSFFVSLRRGLFSFFRWHSKLFFFSIYFLSSLHLFLLYHLNLFLPLGNLLRFHLYK
ncbi:hypothetical protein B9Z19DRAFT_1083999 [Tuber borchii]|uniref:Uncharacterized protein n=1 Tax=Tuber borchii TaxID=42251 RepID=A0A2T6ZSJ8_TUBBO|nr:hypothetical protein B9Z19DRAFT_1083999 [Tuber borchii]